MMSRTENTVWGFLGGLGCGLCLAVAAKESLTDNARIFGGFMALLAIIGTVALMALTKPRRLEH